MEKMEQKKIEELKKLMGFGFLIIDRIRKDDEFLANVFTKKLSLNVLTPMLAQNACVYDLTFLDEKIIESFNEPQTTQLLEKSYAEFIEFKNSDEV
jgi:hypothetical protein